MFIYIFYNPLFKGESKKMILSFPITMWIVEEMAIEGWILNPPITEYSSALDIVESM